MNGVSRADVEFAGDPWDVNLSGSVELNDVTFTARGTEGRALVVGIGDAGDPLPQPLENLGTRQTP